MIICGNSDRPRSSRCNLLNQHFIYQKPRNNFWDKYRFLRWHTIALTMDIEAPSVQVGPSITYLNPLAHIVNGVHTIATIGNHQSMEVTHSNFLNFPLIELRQSKNFLAVVLLVLRSYTHRAI